MKITPIKKNFFLFLLRFYFYKKFTKSCVNIVSVFCIYDAPGNVHIEFIHICPFSFPHLTLLFTYFAFHFQN